MTEIKMPSAGQTTDEASIVSVNVKPGDTVKRGDVLCEAETDKATLPVESFAAGTVLAVRVSEGDTVNAGTVLMVIGKPGEQYDVVLESVSSPEASATVEAPDTAMVPAVHMPVAVGTEIKMPAAGQTTDEATIVSVNVKIGDTVKRGDVLCEAETDKAILPVESFVAGQVFDILVKEGDKVTAGTVLAIVGKESDAARYVRREATVRDTTNSENSVAPVKVMEQEEYLPIIKGAAVVHAAPAAPAVPAVPAAADHPVYPAMPNAKQLAKERGIDIRDVTAANGQFITRTDVARYIPAAQPAAETAAAEAEYEVLPMNRMRQIIGKRMRESLSEIPCWQCTTVIKMDACMALRDAYREKKGVKLSYNDIMAKAIAVASRKFPLVNARYENGEVRVYRHTNVGLAVALDGALVVPVVKEIDAKGLEQIAADYKVQIGKARDNKLLPDDMGCGSITISNLGMYDVEQFIAIDNPPESCILAVGSIKVKPEWDGGKFVPVNMMTVTGSFDHRIIDGAYGAQFLQELKMLMESPALMLY